MVWTAPKVFVDGATLTAEELNIYARDNLLATEAGIATTPGGYFLSRGNNVLQEKHFVEQTISNQETIVGSSAYVHLSTIGPRITIDTDSNVLCFMSFAGSCDDTAYISYTQAAIEITGSTSRPATFASVPAAWESHDNGVGQVSSINYFSGLTPGSNTFTMKYAGETGDNVSFSNRTLIVMPL